MPAELLAERLPGISETAAIFAGVDVTREPIPVLPTVHYNMGGIPTNHLGEVIHQKKDASGNVVDHDAVVPGLFAAGEAACASVHGANRLGANSLLDIVVFGRACALRIADIAKPGDASRRSRGRGAESVAGPGRRAPLVRPDADGRDPPGHAEDDAGPRRRLPDAGRAAEGVTKIDKVVDSFQDAGVSDRSLIWNTDLVETLELRNLLPNAAATMHAARPARRAGAHAPRLPRPPRRRLDEAHDDVLRRSDARRR